jgi:NAD-dependent deacetylase
MKNLVILTGAGISAESGLETFRGSDGLWEGHRLEEVATLKGWQDNPELVQRFHNVQRKKVLEAIPNAAHLALVKLEEKYNVFIITQNVDDLHERAGSKYVLHLHGNITKAQSIIDSTLIYDIEGSDITEKDTCIHGKVLRPHVVWFGENVININQAKTICGNADIFAVIGTSLQVLPAADLLTEVPLKTQIFVIDPNPNNQVRDAIFIMNIASLGIKEMLSFLTDGVFIEQKD